MCYFPKKILNKRYLPTRKNGYNPPICDDERFLYVTIECGHCFECRKKKRNMWRIRMEEQLRETPTATFFTGTLSPQRYKELKQRYNLEDDNDIIKKEIRLFLERIRKQTKRSVKHWIVTELGHENDRIHMHGIFFAQPQQSLYDLNRMLHENWTAGMNFYGYSCGTRTINYVSKYMTKEDEKHTDYIPLVLASPGLGAKYTERTSDKHEFREEDTIETYRNRKGYDMTLPRYYKEKLWSEDERQLLWLYKEEKGDKWIGKTKYNTLTEEDNRHYLQVLREENAKGAAVHHESQEKIDYKANLRRMKRNERFKLNKVKERLKRTHELLTDTKTEEKY